MRVLGLSAFYHDSAAALVEDGRIVAAAQEERFTRKKHDASYPARAASWCLKRAGLQPQEIDRIAFYDKPFLKFERLVETAVAFAPRGFRSFSVAIPVWVKEKLFQKNLLRRKLRAMDADADWSRKLLFAEHHQSHAASAFYPSPFREAVVLTMDGVGEWATTSAAVGRDRSLEVIRELHFPHSLGLLYSAFTYYTGFRVNSGEYKVMGLAPYGEPAFAQAILDNLIDLKPDGTFRLDLDYFGYCTGLEMTNARFDALLGGPPRAPSEPLAKRHMDLAASVQAVVEEAVLRLTRSLRKETGLPNLCMAGGVALNCVANGKVLRDGRFDGIWIQPAAGDAGGALGAALAVSHGLFDEPRPTAPGRRSSDGAGLGGTDAAEDAATPTSARSDAMQGAFLGPEFGPDEVRAALDEAGARYQRLEPDALIGATAEALTDGKVVGWFQGRMEFGPRALGARSILADPRRPEMQKTLNLKIKFRESFRPFAPSVLRSDAAAWFELDGDSPYMLLVADVRPERRRPADDHDGARENGATGQGGPEAAEMLRRLGLVRSEIPAVTHVDDSARVQTVHQETNPRYHALLEAFKARTGCPVLVNTSFNVRGEPIVCTPQEAFRCFMGTDMDRLAIGDFFLRKEDQDPSLALDYKGLFEPD